MRDRLPNVNRGRASVPGQILLDRQANQPAAQRASRTPSSGWAAGDEKVTLKLVAKWANGCDFGAGDPNAIRQKIAAPRRAA
jgi:hypothetical protein